MDFPTTHWSVLAQATLRGETAALNALDQLCRAYWRPLQRFIRHRGFSEADADDLTQTFLVRLCEDSFWRRADAGRGRFRSFLLGALSHFLADERDRRAAQKRGGQIEHVSLDLPAGCAEPVAPADALAFDREWACHVMTSALAQLASEWTDRRELFDVLKRYLPGAGEPQSLEAGAAQLGLSLPALKSQVHRLRERFRELVRQQVAVTVSAPHEIEAELQHLGRVLLQPGTPV